MSRPGVPTIIDVAATSAATNVGSTATEVILRARSSNVQAMSLNVTTSGESDPTSTGGNAMVLFPGESLQLPTDPAGAVTLQVKYITFNDDTDLDDPVLEITEIIP